ncbi:MAG: hypothetical protein HZB13_00140 [Acidobacteria bacterium]|nr:hypothetical protein [Acidobacteriota bacterium]
MNCRGIAANNVIERYSAGTLSQAERDAFELHYFSCADCFEALETIQAIQQELKRAGPQRSQPSWWWGAAAAVVGAGLLLALSGSPQVEWARIVTKPPHASTPLIQLTDIRPPQYRQFTYRGAAAAVDPVFERAMAHFQSGRYAQAFPALSSVLPASPRYWEARHFGGVCLVLLDRPAQALEWLDVVIAQSGRTPFEEEAHYYRAMALLLAGRGPEGRAELGRVAEMHGDYEEQARRWLARL